MKIIGLSGFISSGKDTVANYLIQQYGFQKISFAGILKDVCSVLFGWDRVMLEGDTKESRIFRETVDEWWSKRLNIPNFTPRYAFQHIGTNTLRAHFHDDIWIAAIEKRISTFNPDSKLVFTDCRFVNELECIKRLNGQVWKIERGNNGEWYTYALKASQGDKLSIEMCNSIGLHVSEYAHLNFTFDVILLNDSSLEDLYAKIENIII